MAVRIRLKKMGRLHRPFFRVCAMDQRAPRDGRVIEELGTYDPMVPETDARVTLNCERVEYWLGVGAKPTHKAGVLIRKYGANGTHLDQQQAANERMKIRKAKPVVATPMPGAKPADVRKPEESPVAEVSAEEVSAEETSSEAAASDETESTE